MRGSHVGSLPGDHYTHQIRSTLITSQCIEMTFHTCPPSVGLCFCLGGPLPACLGCLLQAECSSAAAPAQPHVKPQVNCNELRVLPPGQGTVREEKAPDHLWLK